MGQKQTFTRLQPMSALPAKADMDQHGRDVRFVPKAAVSRCSKNCGLFDHLVGELVKLQRDSQVERLRSCAIYYEME